MEKKVCDLFQNAQVNDMQCIAYAYRPINTTHGERIPFLEQSGDNGADPGCAFIVLPYNRPSTDSSSTSSASSSHDNDEIIEGGESSVPDLNVRGRRQRRKSKDSDDSALDFSFQEAGQGNQVEEEKFYKEVVKGQIFLGLATLCHRPKLVNNFADNVFAPTKRRLLDLHS